MIGPGGRTEGSYKKKGGDEAPPFFEAAKSLALFRALLGGGLLLHGLLLRSLLLGRLLLCCFLLRHLSSWVGAQRVYLHRKITTGGLSAPPSY